MGSAGATLSVPGGAGGGRGMAWGWTGSGRLQIILTGRLHCRIHKQQTSIHQKLMRISLFVLPLHWCNLRCRDFRVRVYQQPLLSTLIVHLCLNLWLKGTTFLVSATIWQSIMNFKGVRFLTEKWKRISLFINIKLDSFINFINLFHSFAVLSLKYN